MEGRITIAKDYEAGVLAKTSSGGVWQVEYSYQCWEPLPPSGLRELPGYQLGLGRCALCTTFVWRTGQAT